MSARPRAGSFAVAVNRVSPPHTPTTRRHHEPRHHRHDHRHSGDHHLGDRHHAAGLRSTWDPVRPGPWPPPSDPARTAGRIRAPCSDAAFSVCCGEHSGAQTPAGWRGTPAGAWVVVRRRAAPSPDVWRPSRRRAADAADSAGGRGAGTPASGWSRCVRRYRTAIAVPRSASGAACAPRG